MSRWVGLITMLCTVPALRLPAQASRATTMDALLEHLVGKWRMTGSVRGQPVAYTLDVARVLQRRFVEHR